jgi:hypothetical protein
VNTSNRGQLVAFVACIGLGVLEAAVAALLFGFAPVVGVLIKSLPAICIGFWWLTRGAPWVPTLAWVAPVVVIMALIPVAAEWVIGVLLTVAGSLVTVTFVVAPGAIRWWLVDVWRVSPDTLDF